MHCIILEELANYGPWIKLHPLPIFFKKNVYFIDFRKGGRRARKGEDGREAESEKH